MYDAKHNITRRVKAAILFQSTFLSFNDKTIAKQILYYHTSINKRRNQIFHTALTIKNATLIAYARLCIYIFCNRVLLLIQEIQEVITRNRFTFIF